MIHAIVFDGSGLNAYHWASTTARKLVTREKASQNVDRPFQPRLPKLVCCFSLESDVGIAPSIDLVSISIARASAMRMCTLLAGIVPSTSSPA